MAHNQTRAMLKYAADGWQVFDSGWPDILLVKDTRDQFTIGQVNEVVEHVDDPNAAKWYGNKYFKLRFIEEKSGSRQFSTQQKNLLLALEIAGLDVSIILEGNTEKEYKPSDYFRMEQANMLSTGLAPTTIRNYRVKLSQLEAQLADMEVFNDGYDIVLGKINKLRAALGEPIITEKKAWTEEQQRAKHKAAIAKLDPQVVAQAEAERKERQTLDPAVAELDKLLGGDDEGHNKATDDAGAAEGVTRPSDGRSNVS
jgi:hypothetical protein